MQLKVSVYPLKFLFISEQSLHKQQFNFRFSVRALPFGIYINYDTSIISKGLCYSQHAYPYNKISCFDTPSYFILCIYAYYFDRMLANFSYLQSIFYQHPPRKNIVMEVDMHWRIKVYIMFAYYSHLHIIVSPY